MRRAPLTDIDVAAVEDPLLRVGAVAEEVPERAELDLNPVLVGAEGCAVVDAKVRLAAPVGPDSAAPRQLRPVPTMGGR